MTIIKKNWMLFFLPTLLLYSCSRSNAPHPQKGPEQADCIITDSVEVIYIVYACDCPDWVTYKRYNEFYDKGDTSQGPLFDPDKEGFYVESYNDNDLLDSVKNSRMKVMLYGRIDSIMRYPKNAKFIDPDPPKGRVFIYCKFRITDHGDK